MNRENELAVLRKTDYFPKITPSRLIAWFGLRLLGEADCKDWSFSLGVTRYALALGLAQNDFWDKRRKFQERELPEAAFGIWKQLVEPDFAFVSFYRKLVEWIEAHPNARERFLYKKILASWQKEACRLEMNQAEADPERIGFPQGWQLREKTIGIAVWGVTALACGKEIPQNSRRMLEITKFALAAQVVDDIVGLASDWKRNQITFATLALRHSQSEGEREKLIRAIEKGEYTSATLSQKAPGLFNFLRERANKYLEELSPSCLRIKLAKMFLVGIIRYYPSGYDAIKERRDKSSRLAPFFGFFPQTPD